ncbi:MAG: cytochrome c [Coriobacteriia bacterium]|nr:cytochrome c [Coriobacteriia bacterium]
MTTTRAATFVLLLVLAITVVGCSSQSTAPQSTTTNAPSSTSGSAGSAAQLGQQIFSTGNAADGSALPVTSGAGGPCARCHGNDATGMVGPDIRWSVLTGSASSSHAPRFPLTSEAQFVTAVTTGQAGGNALRPMMPHYQLTAAQSAAIIAYLKTL